MSGKHIHLLNFLAILFSLFFTLPTYEKESQSGEVGSKPREGEKSGSIREFILFSVPTLNLVNGLGVKNFGTFIILIYAME